MEEASRELSREEQKEVEQKREAYSQSVKGGGILSLLRVIRGGKLTNNG